MARKRVISTETEQGDGVQLRHVLVVGGTVAEWDALGHDLWVVRRVELAKVVAHAGAMWLTLRPYELRHEDADASGPAAPMLTATSPGPAFRTERLVDVREGCTVIVDPSADGRRRLLGAIEQLRDAGATAVDEDALTGVLMSPAPCEPDLTIVLGPPSRLPPSLVWELAYSEIVFIETGWDELAAAHVERAMDQFSRRHRRFGGIS